MKLDVFVGKRANKINAIKSDEALVTESMQVRRKTDAMLMPESSR